MEIRKVIIYNPVPYHYECIESVIHYLPKILKDKTLAENLEIILNISTRDAGFVKYITTYTSRLLTKYSLGSIQIINTKNELRQPQIIMPSTANEARVVLTIDKEKFIKNITTYYEQYTYVILHNYFKTRPKLPNIFYLAPHCGNPDQFFIPIVLPFSPESVSHVEHDTQQDGNRPLNLLVQGNIKKRNMHKIQILIDLVKVANKKATLAGRPPINLFILTKYNPIKLLEQPNIIVKINIDFWEFNQIASQCDVILPLVGKKTHPEYFNIKLTSSISYGLGYNMKFIIDSELPGLFNIDASKCHTYSSIREFRSTLITVFKNHLKSDLEVTGNSV